MELSVSLITCLSVKLEIFQITNKTYHIVLTMMRQYITLC